MKLSPRTQVILSPFMLILLTLLALLFATQSFYFPDKKLVADETTLSHLNGQIRIESDNEIISMEIIERYQYCDGVKYRYNWENGEEWVIWLPEDKEQEIINTFK